ncbi:MAG: DUF6517 family protein [Halobacteria archaeon]
MTQEKLSFEATPVGVEQNSLSDTGYSTYSSGWNNVTRNVTVAGQKRTIDLANYVAEYRRPLGNGTEGGFGVFATPKAKIATQTANPVDGWSDKQFIKRVPNPYGSVSRLKKTGTRKVTMLSQQTTASIFSGVSSSGTDIVVQIARVNDKDDIVVAGSVHSNKFNETTRITKLFENVRHSPSKSSMDERQKEEEKERDTGQPEQKQNETSKVPTVKVDELNRNPEEFMGQKVKIEGYYSTRSIDMLVSNYTDVVTNNPLPKNSYVPLIPEEADGKLTRENEGYTVQVMGVVKEREPNGDLEKEDATEEEVKADIWEPEVKVEVQKVGILELENRVKPYLNLEKIKPDKFRVPKPQLTRSSCPFAVILSGGINQANNFKRYWQGTVQTYQAMNGTYNLPDDQIYVNYWNGTPDSKVNGRNIVDRNARQSNVDATFRELKKRVGKCQNQSKKGVRTEVMMFTYNHGSEDKGKNLIGSQILTPDELRDHLVDLRTKGADQINIMMMQCYSGHFINLTSSMTGRSTKDSVTSIATAANNQELSWGKDYGWNFVAALAGQFPGGSSVNADSDGDGTVEWNEAYTYAKKNDKFGPNGQDKEHPQYFNNARWLDPDQDGVHSSYDNQPHTYNPNQ